MNRYYINNIDTNESSLLDTVECMSSTYPYSFRWFPYLRSAAPLFTPAIEIKKLLHLYGMGTPSKDIFTASRMAFLKIEGPYACPLKMERRSEAKSFSIHNLHHTNHPLWKFNLFIHFIACCCRACEGGDVKSIN